MGIPGSQRVTATIYVLVMPSGAYFASQSIPPNWITECEVSGAMIRTVKATIPVPMMIPDMEGEDITDAA